MYQLWLAAVLRDANLVVHEVDGWRTRTSYSDPDGTAYAPRGLIIHETRGGTTSTDAGELNVLVNGRVGLSGPISQLYLSRSGAWWVVAAGKCHHVRTGWAGPFAGLGNANLMGIEAQHADGEPWTAVQYSSYVRGAAAILAHTGWPPPVGHKEHQPGDKTDPLFDMTRFRADVAAAMKGHYMDSNQAAQLAEVHKILTTGERTGAANPTPPHQNQTIGGVPVLYLPKQFHELDAAMRAVSSKLDGMTRVDPAALAAALAADPGFVDDLAAVLARHLTQAQQLTVSLSGTATPVTGG